ncbi:Tubby- protein 3 [Gaertneriomyces sp. JEL0708]|nr:Tubby- protein 3 [Gaertneriomyces sp. JEL0708]
MPVDVAPVRMTPGEDPNAALQLKQLKKELKEWERQFAEREGRKPGKTDITGDKEIARRYKVYNKLKASVDSTASPQEEAPAEPPRRPKSAVRTKSRQAQSKEASGVEVELAQTLDTSAKPGTSPVAKAAGKKGEKSRTTRDHRADEQDESIEAGDLEGEAEDHTSKTVRFSDSDTDTPNVRQQPTLTSNLPTTDVSTSGPEARPWGTAGALPDNFKLRRNTLSSGPRPTADIDTERPGSGRGNSAGRRLTLPEDSSRPSSGASAGSGFDTPESGEFLDFMNRKRELETIASKPPHAVSAAEALKAQQELQSSARQRVMPPTPTIIRPTPVVTTITVRPSSPPSSKMAAADPPKVTEVRHAAKAYEPDEEEDSDAEIIEDTSAGAREQSFSSIINSKVPRKATAFADASAEQDKLSEDEADNDATADSKELIAPAGKPTASTLGADAIGTATDPSVSNPRVFFRLPEGHILRCKLYRKKNLLDKAHPTFFLYNQADEQFLLAARKRKKSKSVNYVISNSHVDLSKDSKHYIAKLKANFSRTNFTLYDARSYNPRATNKGLRELACVSYSKTVLPREMSVAIPAKHIEELSDQLSQDIMTDIKTQNTEKLLFLRNKPPRWNEATQSHCLNFGGRVTHPSIKNFQLIGTGNENFVVMQFGRCGPDYFTLDVRYPMTPLEAFCVALSTFDAYDNA